MNKKEFKDVLTGDQKIEMEKLIAEITEEAKLSIEDYVKNPSEVSGSIIQIHENSPLIKE